MSETDHEPRRGESSRAEYEDRPDLEPPHGLSEAIALGRPDLVNMLLEQGADVNEKMDEDGTTPLVLALQNGHHDVARMLVYSGADVNNKHGEGSETALHMAAESGWEDVARLLLDYGADVEATTRYPIQDRTPLQVAAFNGHEDVVTVLLNAGADVDHQDAVGHTALSDAAMMGHDSTVELLLEYGADVEGGVESNALSSPLSMACRGGYYAVAKLLLDAGAKVYGRDMPSRRPLDSAVAAGNVELARLLLERGATLVVPQPIRMKREMLPTIVLVPSRPKAIKRASHGASGGSFLHRASSRFPWGASAISRHGPPLAAWHGDTARHSSGLSSGMAVPSPGHYSVVLEPVTNESMPASEPLAQDGIPTLPRMDEEQVNPPRPSSEVSRSRRGGASKPAWEDTPNPDMIDLLEGQVALEGPKIGGFLHRSTPTKPVGPFITPPPKRDHEKQRCCNRFEIAMLEFHVDGGEEWRLPVNASVNEVLYGEGPEALLTAAREKERKKPQRRAKLQEKASFTWYHIPANNLTWAEHLITRLRAEREAAANNTKAGKRYRRMNEDTRKEMRLAYPQQSARPEAFSSFLGSSCDILPPSETGERIATMIMPYLHYETHAHLGAMRQAVQRSIHYKSYLASLGSEYGVFQRTKEPAPRPFEHPRHTPVAVPHPPPPVVEHAPPPVPGQFKPGDNFTEMQLKREGQVLETQMEAPGVAAAEGDMSGISNTKAKSTSNALSGDVPEDGDNFEKLPDATNPELTTKQKTPIGSALPHRGVPLRESARPFGHPPPLSGIRKRPAPVVPRWAMHQELLMAYPGGRDAKDGGAQTRRSLDQYKYAHVGNLKERDADQVVYRYTRKHGHEPKLFMVDQLWMWTLGDDTLVTCIAPRWNLHSNATPFDIGSSNDPTDVYQAVQNHLRKFRRKPIVSVHDLGSLVATECVSVFHQPDVPRYCHFFDFFEKTVTELLNHVTQNLEDMRDDHVREVPSTLGSEMESLIEAADILDELEMLKEVLYEQLQIADRHNEMLRSHGVQNIGEPDLISTAATHSHIFRVEAMQRQTKKAQDMLISITDLKQKHNNHMETVTAAQQAAASAKQSNAIVLFTVITIIFLPISFMAAFFAINIDGFKLTKDGKLPLNYVIKYMVSVGLALSLPFIVIAFNLDKAAELLNYAKNKTVELRNRRVYAVCFLAAGVVATILATIWTSHVAANIKVAVTIAVVAAIVGCGAVWGMYLFTDHVRQLRDKSSLASTASSEKGWSSVAD